MIPFLVGGASYPVLGAFIFAALDRVMTSGWYIGGTEVENFENEFAAYCGAVHCVSTGNGLEALALSLVALGVGQGDEVIVPANTYIATWLAVSMAGATPVPVEPDGATHCIDPTKIEAAITERSKCIMPVHLYGHPCAMDEIVRIARTNGLMIVEDAAQAHGAAWNGQKIGSHGDAVAWSFYPTKNLGAFGDAGAITTNNGELADKLRLLRNYGSREKNVHEVKGVNSRLDPLQAAILSVKLRHLDEWNARRQNIANFYDEAFAGLNSLTAPLAASGAVHAWHLYVMRFDRRDEVIASLERDGVGTAIHYPTPPFRQEAYLEFAPDADRWPISDAIAQTVLSIPIGPHLSLEDARRVADAVRRAVGA